MNDVGREAAGLETFHDSWVPDALADVRLGRADVWRSRADQIDTLINNVSPIIEHLGPLTRVEVLGGDQDRLLALVLRLRDYLGASGQLKVNSDGSPRVGAFTSKVVKDCRPVFELVRINGRPPATLDQLSSILAYDYAERTLTSLDHAWPATTVVPAEDTFAERLAWHVTELHRLRTVLRFGTEIEDSGRYLGALALPRPNWIEPNEVSDYAHLADAAAAEDARVAATAPLKNLELQVESAAQWSDAAPRISDMLSAVRGRDRDRYASSYARLRRLAEASTVVARRDELGRRMRSSAAALYAAVVQSSADEAWFDRLANLQAAWSWASTGAWVKQQDVVDSNSVQARIDLIELELHHEVERLAAARAWRHAVAPERLTGRRRADLHHYAQLVRKLGKGTGKYAEQQRGDIRQAMDRCRDAVPVWIMPIYRVAEQLRVAADMFDVVVVDEASQAGLEATFLQYLAPTMVVIGDDKQVSPSAVGVDRQQLRDLGEQYLSRDRYKASWVDPTHSFFDGAVMRYGSRITLTEHRRCVPEIIAFSNMIAYEPEGKRLIPVRQYGSDRLEPIKVIHTSDGYEKGWAAKVNPVEVEAIVGQIEKCFADPRYDGKTLGVISLLGSAQARAIERALLERVPPEEWTARDLRCGDPADFQGSERDVVFLSMVASAEPDRRLAALTHEQYVQRYNVAVSRAKDQL
jgi:hypothetical protein